MLEKPDLDDARLSARLAEAYGLRAAALAFLPLGADVGTAVYRVETQDGHAYFLKLRRGPFDEMTVALPRFLSDQGIEQIIAPLTTLSGQLWSSLDGFTLTLYPFVDGEDGYAARLTERQWVQFGAAAKRIHTASLPDAIRRALPRETYSARWREQVKAFESQVRGVTHPDPVASALAALWQAQASTIHALVEAAQHLGQVLQSQPQAWVFCHADLHPGNILIGRHGLFFIVDWDTALLAPKERDLMFIGSGHGTGWDQPQEAGWFYQGYGQTALDPAALAYYRCERIVQDIATFCEEILSTTQSSQDRAQSLRYLSGNFGPDGDAAIALGSYRAID